MKNRECMEREMFEIKEEVDKVMKRAAAIANERERLIERRNQILQQDSKRQDVFENEYGKLCKFIADQAKSLEESIANAADSVTTQLNVSNEGQRPISKIQDRVSTINDEYALTQKSL